MVNSQKKILLILIRRVIDPKLEKDLDFRNFKYCVIEGLILEKSYSMSPTSSSWAIFYELFCERASMHFTLSFVHTSYQRCSHVELEKTVQMLISMVSSFQPPFS